MNSSDTKSLEISKFKNALIDTKPDLKSNHLDKDKRDQKDKKRSLERQKMTNSKKK